MNEAETRAELIDPALAAAGWGTAQGSRVRREVITNGRNQMTAFKGLLSPEKIEAVAKYVETLRKEDVGE